MTDSNQRGGSRSQHQKAGEAGGNTIKREQPERFSEMGKTAHEMGAANEFDSKTGSEAGKHSHDNDNS